MRAAGRARSGWTDCWCSTRPPSVAKARRSTACASTGSWARPGGCRAGDLSLRGVAGGPAHRWAQVVDAHSVDERLEVVAVHDLGPVVQVDVGDGRQRLTVSRGTDLDPAVERPADEQQHGVLGAGVRFCSGVVGQRASSLLESRHARVGAVGPQVPPERRSTRATRGAVSSIAKSRSTWTARTKVASAPLSVAVARTAYSPPGVVAR